MSKDTDNLNTQPAGEGPRNLDALAARAGHERSREPDVTDNLNTQPAGEGPRNLDALAARAGHESSREPDINLPPLGEAGTQLQARPLAEVDAAPKGEVVPLCTTQVIMKHSIDYPAGEGPQSYNALAKYTRSYNADDGQPAGEGPWTSGVQNEGYSSGLYYD